MKYLKKFNSIEEYEAYINGSDVVYPNVSYVSGSFYVKYNAIPVPLYVEALNDLTVSFTINKIEYSLDLITWTDLPAGTATPTIKKGEKVYFKATGLSAVNNEGIGTFSMTDKCNIGGNVMSLRYGDDFANKTMLANYQFYALFKNCVNVINADKLELPATTMSGYCYSYMFYGCTSLVNAPELPATTMSSYCYGYMFYRCTSLVNAPELPATTMYSYCYYNMFYGCTSLVNAPELPATTMSSYCYGNMFYGCSKLNYVKAMFTTTPGTSYTAKWLSGVSSTGTFVKNAAATWNVTGVNGIPEGWTVETAAA